MSEITIRRAIKAGRIKPLSNGRVDPVQADAALAAPCSWAADLPIFSTDELVELSDLPTMDDLPKMGFEEK